MQKSNKSFSDTLSIIPPPLQVVLAILSIQLGAAFAINLFSIFGPVGTVFFRLIISACLLCLFIRPKFTENALKHYKLLVLYGVALGLMNWCFYESIARIPLGIAVAIEFMGPLLVAVYSSRRFLDFLWIVVAFIGVKRSIKLCLVVMDWPLGWQSLAYSCCHLQLAIYLQFSVIQSYSAI